MFEQIDDLEAELRKLEATLPDVYASGDRRAIADAGRRQKELQPVVDAYTAYRTTEHDLDEAREMLKGETDAEMRAFLDAEVESRQARLVELEAELKDLLLPRDPNDSRHVIVEIPGTESGE